MYDFIGIVNSAIAVFDVLSPTMVELLPFLRFPTCQLFFRTQFVQALQRFSPTMSDVHRPTPNTPFKINNKLPSSSCEKYKTQSLPLEFTCCLHECCQENPFPSSLPGTDSQQEIHSLAISCSSIPANSNTSGSAYPKATMRADALTCKGFSVVLSPRFSSTSTKRDCLMFLQGSSNDLRFGRMYHGCRWIFLPRPPLFGDGCKEHHFLATIAMPLLLFGSSGFHQKCVMQKFRHVDA